MLQKEGAMARNDTRISNTFCIYGKSDSVYKPYSRTFPNNGDGYHCGKPQSDSETTSLCQGHLELLIK